MKRRLCALALCLALPLCACSAMLEREQTSRQPHPQTITVDQDPSVLEAATYQELVSAILYLVTQHSEEGTVRLYNYAGEVEADLTAACLEVVQKDPLGAYAVDYIKHEVSRIVSYYEAQLTLSYRRTTEEMARVVSVTGSGAIKSELRETFSGFGEQCVLRVSYLPEDGDYLQSLIRQAYYDTPQTAFGLPQVRLTLYPESGVQRIVEAAVEYPLSPSTRLTVQTQLSEAVEALFTAQTAPATPRTLFDLLTTRVERTDSADCYTAHDALVRGRANAEGLALAYKLLCDRAGLSCTVVTGEKGGAPHFWNIVTTESGSRHVDLAAGLYALTDLQLQNQGAYVWDSGYPICRDGSEIQIY